jgi:hypothetical protein
MRYLAVFLFSGLLWGGFFWITGLDRTDGRTPEVADGESAPEFAVRAMLDPEREAAFFGAVHDFAVEKAFAVRVGSAYRDNRPSIVEARQADVFFLASESADVGRYGVAFYRNCNSPVPDRYIQDLAEDLGKRLNGISGVSASVERLGGG